MISAIVAVDNNWGIGYNGDLLEHIPEDLKYFKALTTGHVVVMGRKTWDSLPTKPLPNRHNIVITRTALGQHDGADFWAMNATKTFMRLRKDQYEYFIIGGGTIYKELLSLCDRVYITKIYKDHDNVDTYFPNLDESEEWAPATCGQLLTHNDLTYQFWQYDRIS